MHGCPEFLSDLLPTIDGLFLGSDSKRWDGSKLINLPSGHRKWSWADEQSWNAAFNVPMATLGGWTKYAGNPVLGPTELWEGTALMGPTVVKYNNIYYMVYAGNVASPQLGIASSTDKVTWTKSPNNPIISNGFPAWKTNWVSYPHLIIDITNNVYRLYMTGYNGAVYRGGTATCPLSADPMVITNWTEDAGNPVETSGDFMGGALKIGNIWYMLTQPVAFNLFRLRFSNSPTGPWTLYGTVMSVGAAGQWDDSEISNAHSFWSLGNFYLFYTGRRVGIAQKVGVACAGLDGIAYQKLFGNLGNPIITVGAAGQWDQTNVYAGAVMMEDESFYMWYWAYDAALTKFQIGLATLNLSPP
jgi:hypothetical protein